ncbi:MAG: carboxypeptidase-like regulatory domain-containing protein [Planctomycetia bacterium]|nr:carboxypeptidase-like regulatory domain-containing protein [Planctomycetia bacterium]
MKKHLLFIYIAAIVGLALNIAGCGPQKIVLVPVEGHLTLNGEPVEGVSVCLTPKEVDGRLSAGATTDAEGHFVLSCGNETGCSPGEYTVSVVKIEHTGDSMLNTQIINHLPLQYADPASSGLTATVTKGMEPLKFDLTQ